MTDNSGGVTPNQPSNPRADAKAAKAYAKASRPWYKKKRWWAVGAIVLIIIISAASGGGDSIDDPDTTASETTPSAEPSKKGAPSEEPEPEEPKAMKVEAKTILKEFEENEAAADGKYKDKTLQVTGVVAKVDTEIMDEDEYVVQVGAGTDFDFITVNCDDQSSEAVSSLKKGDDITVVGDFEDGGDLGVELENCKIA